MSNVTVTVSPVSNVTPEDIRRTRRGGPTGPRAEWIKTVASLGVNQKYVFTISGVDNEEEFNARCTSMSTSLYRKNADGNYAIGFKVSIRKNFSNRTFTVIRIGESAVSNENSVTA